MPTATSRLSVEDPVHFRVTDFGPSPLPDPSRPGALHLRIAFVNQPGSMNFLGMAARFAPYADDLVEAMASRHVYRVDLNDPETPNWPPRPNDTTLDRLLEAIKNRQIVPSDADAEN